MGVSIVDRVHAQRAAEKRTLGGVPWTPWTNPFWRFNIGGPTHPSRQVMGQDAVLGLAAVYAAVRYLSDTIASLPINVYRQMPDGSRQRISTSFLLGNPITGNGPQPAGTFYDWVFQGTMSCALWGNAWGLITNRSGIAGPDGLGLPSGVAWLPPDRVTVQDDEQQPENPLRARIYYNGTLMDSASLVQLRAFPVPGRLEAISPMRAFATLHQQGLDALRYSAEWFENGGFPPGTFQNLNEEVHEGEAKEIRRRLTDTIRQRQPLVFGKDWDYKPITVPQDEAVFIQAMQLNATQVAAIYGVPAWRVGGKKGDSMSYTNQQEDAVDTVTNTVRPWCRRWESLLTGMLPSTQYAKFDLDDLLTTDRKTRTDIEVAQRNAGLRTANELRTEDDLPKQTGGDDPLPLGVLERMMATTRAYPKSIGSLLAFESQDTVAQLQQLQSEGLVEDTGKPPVPVTASSYLGKMLATGRSSEPLSPREAWRELYRRKDEIPASQDGARQLQKLAADWSPAVEAIW